LLIFLFFEYLTIKLIYNVNLSFLNYFIKYSLLLIIFYPVAKVFTYIEIHNEK